MADIKLKWVGNMQTVVTLVCTLQGFISNSGKDCFILLALDCRNPPTMPGADPMSYVVVF